MTNTPQTVSLDVRSSNCGSPAFTDAAELVAGTPNPNNLSYSYVYTGGSDSHGNVDEDINQGVSTITVHLIASTVYKLAGIVFNSVAHSQVSETLGADGRSAVLSDLNTAAEVDYYKVLITDTGNGNCQFYCDPRITNK